VYIVASSSSPVITPVKADSGRRGLRSVFRYDDGIIPNLLALAYILGGYAGGWVFLFSRSPWIWMAGVLLVAHSMIISAYFFHELVHHTIFRSSRVNRRMMVIISWINGSCLANLPRTEKKHLAHHFQKADVVSFDFRQWLTQHPAARRLVISLEWLYIPAVELLMRGAMISQPWSEHSPHRYRVLGVLAIRTVGWLAVLAWYWPAALGYILAGYLFITVLRFVDAFQHTYEPIVAHPNGPAPTIPPRDPAYEEENTYSNLLSHRFPVLNLLTLNFVYHNVHHALPGLPWHRLRHYHETQYLAQHGKTRILPLSAQLRWYHRYRVQRVLASDYGDLTQGFIGAVAVSFLTVM